MTIAILGWGSLIWDQRDDFDSTHDPWKPDGPRLKLEFSRVSRTRERALTLVIDERHGEECQVSYAASKRSNIDDAICDLKCREGTILGRIGFIVADDSRTGDPAVPHPIRAWMEERQLAGVVWTGLTSNFLEETKTEFSVSNAVRHLQSLPSKGKTLAAEYVWRAPDFVSTPLRRALEVEPWFAQSS